MSLNTKPDRREALKRPDVWNNVENYVTEIYSLWHHSNSRSVIRDRISRFATGDRAIDLGCGEGHWLEELRNFRKIVGIDFSISLVDRIATPPPQTEIVLSDICSLLYEGEFDFALNLNAFAPESHTAALQKFSTILRLLKPGGRLIWVVSSAECYQTIINLMHFHRSALDDELSSPKETIDIFFEKSDNPLGYVKQENGTVLKFWIKEEAEIFFKMCGSAEILEYFRIPRGSYQQEIEGLEPWFHGWVIEKSA